MGRAKKTKGRNGIIFRSGFEATIATQLYQNQIEFEFERDIVTYLEPAYIRKYIPDFFLPNGIIIEAKGIWALVDRKKIVLVREQNPQLDIRMLFQRDQPLNKGSKTRYSEWCEKRGIPYAVGKVPDAWLSEAKEKRA